MTEPFNTWAALLACSIVGLACAAIVDATPFRMIAARCLRFCGWCLLTCASFVCLAAQNGEHYPVRLMGDMTPLQASYLRPTQSCAPPSEQYSSITERCQIS